VSSVHWEPASYKLGPAWTAHNSADMTSLIFIKVSFESSFCVESYRLGPLPTFANRAYVRTCRRSFNNFNSLLLAQYNSDRKTDSRNGFSVQYYPKNQLEPKVSENFYFRSDFHCPLECHRTHFSANYALVAWFFYFSLRRFQGNPKRLGAMNAASMICR